MRILSGSSINNSMVQALILKDYNSITCENEMKPDVYVYTTNDALEYDSAGNVQENTYDVQTINCISSADMVNWTDHGAI